MPREIMIPCLALLLVRCTGGQPSASEPPTSSPGGAASTSADGATAGAGGGAGATGTADFQFVAEPRFVANPNPSAPLVGIVEARTNLPSQGSIEVSGGGESWQLALEPTTTEHRRAVLGLAPDTSYQVTIRLQNGEQELVSPPLEWRTPALPADFPTLELVSSDPSRMEPGMTLFDARLRGFLVVVDALGTVRWYYRAARQTTGHRLTEQGHLLFVSGNFELLEIDWSGNPVAGWYSANSTEPLAPTANSIPVDLPLVRHTVFEMPNGNILTLSDEVRTVDDYPTSTSDPSAPTTSAQVRGDLLVEIRPDGSIEKEIALLDLLDPTRVGRDSVGPGLQDWGHCNAASYDPAKDAYLVSCRHQDAVVEIDRETESLVWILGNHENWREPWLSFLLTASGDELSWAYHQHAAEVVPGGVGVFDNGNYGAAAFEDPLPEVFSRAVRYGVDEDTMTVTQTFSYTPNDETGPLYANAMGDADRQPVTGNTLLTSGTLQTNDDPPRVWVQLLEVTSDASVVFELRVRGDPESSQPNTSTFEADRIPDVRFIEGD